MADLNINVIETILSSDIETVESFRFMPSSSRPVGKTQDLSNVGKVGGYF